MPSLRRIFFLLFVLTLGSTAAFGQHSLKRFTADERKARDYVLANTERNAPYELNMADEQQYKFVMATLRLHGDSPKQSPELFRQLAAARKTGKAGPPKMATASAAADGDISPAINTNLIQYLWNNAAGGYVDTSLLSSGVGGTDSTTMMVNFTIINESQPFAVSPVFQQDAGGEDFVEPYQAALPASVTASVDPATIVENALFILTQNGTTTPFTMTVNGTVPASCQCVTAPNYKLNQQFPPCPAAQGACSTDPSICINKGNISQSIESCYGRNDGNCNYGWGGSGYPPYITLQVSGTISFSSPIATALQGSYLLNLQNTVGGGGCFLPPVPTPNPLSPTYFSIDPTNSSQLNYCFPAQQFTNNSCLTTALSNVYVNFNVYVLLANGGYGNATVSSAPDTWHQPWYAQIPVVEVLQGCLLEGTQVLTADGTMKAIETFKGNGTEMIVANNKGDVMAVTGTMSGVEDRPMYRVTTKNGKTVTMTEQHPVPTSRGLLMASQLRTGQIVFTRDGTSAITKIEKTPAGAKIWNLKIGTQDDAETNRATFFANGVLTGDATMQKMLIVKSREKGMSKEEVLARLPKAWHQDYLNHLNQLHQQ